MEAGQRIRDLILEEKIGAGGAGEVWRARHQYLDTPFAVKAIYRHTAQGSDFHARFLEEASVMARLEHPHIVAVHDFFVLNDVSYLVMSYIDGGSLEDLLRRHGRLSLVKALHISRGLLAALNFAHSRGVIHRDVKPSNILIRSDEHVYLVDFGIALVVGKQRHTRFGTNIGTPEYMSPEQIQAQEIDHRTDVYSVGCVLYEMLSGRPPFSSQDAGQAEYAIMSGHLHAQPPSLRAINPEVDAHIEEVVLHALAKAPDHRYGGCQELADDLYREYHPPRSVDHDGPQSHRDYQFLKRMSRNIKKLYVAIPLLLMVFMLVFWTNIKNILNSSSYEKAMLQKITEGQLVLPRGEAAYDLWQNSVKDRNNHRTLPRALQERLFLQLSERGEQFLQHWQETFAATDEEWREIARVYEWAVRLQAAQTNGEASIDVSVEQLCPGLQEEMQRLCARYSYSMGQIDSREGRLKEAARNYDKAQYYDKSLCLSYIGIGEIYIKEKSLANAVEPFKKSIQCNKNLCYGYFHLGELFQTRNQYDSAISSYKEAISCATDNTDFIFKFAKLYENLGQYCNSFSLFRDFLKNETKRKNSPPQSLTDYMEKYSSSIAKQYACN